MNDANFNSFLKNLNNYTKVDLPKLNSDQFIVFCKALKNNSSITSIKLNQGFISDAEAIKLVEALENNSKITHLDLSFNEIGNIGINALALALGKNSSITFLSFEGNNIGDVGTIALASALETNSSITHLNLAFNGIGIDGSTKLAEALKINSSITSLNLQLNQIRSAGAIELAEALKINSSITSLNLSFNNIGDKGVNEILNIFEHNYSTTSLDISMNDTSSSLQPICNELTQRNQDPTIWFYPKNPKGFTMSVLPLIEKGSLYLKLNEDILIKTVKKFSELAYLDQEEYNVVLKNAQINHLDCLYLKGVCKVLHRDDAKKDSQNLHLSDLPPEIRELIFSYCKVEWPKDTHKAVTTNSIEQPLMSITNDSPKIDSNPPVALTGDYEDSSVN